MINNYFQELDKSLAEVFPENINYDETNLSDDPERRRLIFKRGARYPERIINGTKASTSLMLAGTAAGHVLPVYVVYKSDNLWSTWTEGGPPRARYNRIKSGWFENVTFVDWFKTIALPYCTRLEAGSKKVLIGDNLWSHFSNEVLDLCENNINFICMPPNATHLCQPLDVAYFAPMKRQWRKILTDFKQSNRKNAGTVPKDGDLNLTSESNVTLKPDSSGENSGYKPGRTLKGKSVGSSSGSVRSMRQHSQIMLQVARFA